MFPVSIFEPATYFRETWYERYTVGDHHKVFFNSLP